MTFRLPLPLFWLLAPGFWLLSTAFSTSLTPPHMSIYSTTILSDSPLLYCRFGALSGTAVADSSGNGNNGSFTGSCTPGQAGLIACDNDAGLLFAGGTVTIPLSSCPGGSSPRSFEFWLRTSQPAADYIDIFWSGVHAGGQAFECYLTTGTGTVLFTDQSSIHHGSTPVNDGNVHHIVMTYDGTMLSIYVDAVLDFSTAYSATTSATVNLKIGAGDSTAYAGIMDEFAVYAAALSASRIKAHYNAGIVEGIAMPVIVGKC